MKKRILIIFSVFLLSINCILSSTITAYASGYSREDTTGFNDWSLADKARWWKDNLLSLLGGAVGCLVNPFNWNYDHYMDYFHSAALDKQIADESTDYQDYIGNRVSMNDSGEFVLNDELVDLMYTATVEYIEQETGWYTGRTFQTADLTSQFTDLNFYRKVEDIIEGLNANEVARVVFTPSGTTMNYTTTDGVVKFSKTIGTQIFVCSYDGLVMASSSSTAVTPYYEWEYSSRADNSVKKRYVFDTDNNDVTDEFMEFWQGGHEYGANGYTYLLGNTTAFPIFTTDYCAVYKTGPAGGFVKPTKESVRIYKTYEDYKDYSLGNRPYYITDKFQDYDINGDNSCILSESDLENSSVYGDVYNYITNNYDNPDGLTEQELIDILNNYFGNLDLDGSGSGSGSNDSGGSGLSGFLSGIGSIGDAVLSILGKLLEYVGKALDLLSNTATKVIDLVPKNITNLLGGLFPFLPQEWLTAIELSLVLAVIIGIVGIFKK